MDYENNTGYIIAQNFKNFLHSQDADPYEVALFCGQLLVDNKIRCGGTMAKYLGGVNLYDLELDEI